MRVLLAVVLEILVGMLLGMVVVYQTGILSMFVTVAVLLASPVWLMFWSVLVICDICRWWTAAQATIVLTSCATFSYLYWVL